MSMCLVCSWKQSQHPELSWSKYEWFRNNYELLKNSLKNLKVSMTLIRMWAQTSTPRFSQQLPLCSSWQAKIRSCVANHLRWCVTIIKAFPCCIEILWDLGYQQTKKNKHQSQTVGIHNVNHHWPPSRISDAYSLSVCQKILPWVVSTLQASSFLLMLIPCRKRKPVL